MVPVHDPDAIQLDALVVLHVNVELAPLATLGGDAVRVSVGTLGAATVIVAECVTVPPGADIGFHVHAESEEEIDIVMDGSGKMRRGGSELANREGAVIANAPGGGHGLVNDSGSDLRLVVVQCSGTAGPARPAGPQGAQG